MATCRVPRTVSVKAPPAKPAVVVVTKSDFISVVQPVSASTWASTVPISVPSLSNAGGAVTVAATNDQGQAPPAALRGKRVVTMSTRKNARQWARLRMLCCTGTDAVSLAPAAFSVIAELVPNASSALFLTTHKGVPQARVHEDCPEHVTQLCLHHDSGLFDGPNDPTYPRLYSGPRKVGQMLAPPANYYRSNTYQLLIRASGHHHSLDGRLEVDRQRLGMIWLFREPGAGFSPRETADMARITTYFEHALRASRPAWDEEDRAVECEAMLVANARGNVLFASPEAQQLLNAIPLVGTEWPDRRRLPPVCLRLIDILRDDASHPGRMPAISLPLPGGTLEVRAQWLGAPGGDDAVEAMAAEQLVGIVLTRTTPMSLRIWRNLEGAALSPTQLEVAYWMAMGSGRESARARMSISEAVLRDCVKAIYDRLQTTGRGAGGEIQLTDGIAALLGEETVYAYAFEGRRYDCGSKLGYLEATVEFGLRHEHLGDRFANYLAQLVADRLRR